MLNHEELNATNKELPMFDESNLTKDIISNYLFYPEKLLFDRADQQTKDGKWFYTDMGRIAMYYHRYHNAVSFKPVGYTERKLKENAEGRLEETEVIAYQPARTRFKKMANLINKQARFMFGLPVEITLEIDMDTGNVNGDVTQSLSVTQEMVNNVLTTNSFYAKLLTAFKDCCVGKRVACVINFDNVYGVSIDFLSAFHFTYEYDIKDSNKLCKFAYHRVLSNGNCDDDILYIKKRYWLDYMEGVTNPDPDIDKRYCYVSEEVHNHDGEDVTEDYINETGIELFSGRLDIDFIPAEVIINHGMLDQRKGVSDIEDLQNDEAWYNFLSGLDIDSLKKNMNPMKYTVDMDSTTTQTITNRLGGYADLQSDRKDPESKSPSVGLLESNLNYVQALDDMLDKFEYSMHEATDVPNINLETMASTITSGKALRAVYWGLIQRCNEKFNSWQPAIESIVTMVINGLYVYNQAALPYLSGETFPAMIPFEVIAERQDPIPDDENLEKTSDMAEVQNGVRSRRSYLEKWHNMNPQQANQELIQIAIEQNLLDNLAVPEGALSDNELYQILSEVSVPGEETDE